MFFVLLMSLIPLVSAEEVGVNDDFIVLPLIGEINVGDMPLIVSTVLIASADGLNPCSIWVLLFLLGIIIHTKSRKKIALVGGVFLLVTASIYGLFIAGVFSILDFMEHTTWIIYLVVAIALIFGIVNVKDYFWYKKGVSFTISDKYKPRIFKQVRELMKKESTPGLVGATALMAAGIAIIELPCTAGLPLIWSGIIASADVTISYYWYLLLYVFVYLLIEIIILVSVLVSLKSFKMDEFKGRALKLIGGVLIIALGLVLLLDRTIMYSISSAFLVIIGAIVLSFLIMGVERLYSRWKK